MLKRVQRAGRAGRIRGGALVLGLALATAGAGGALAGEGQLPFWVEAPRGSADGRPGSFAALADTLSPAVVNIRVTRTAEAQGRAPHPLAPATASGFVISPDGYIATNNHVVAEAGELEVSFLDGSEYPARIIGRDPE